MYDVRCLLSAVAMSLADGQMAGCETSLVQPKRLPGPGSFFRLLGTVKTPGPGLLLATLRRTPLDSPVRDVS